MDNVTSVTLKIEASSSFKMLVIITWQYHVGIPLTRGDAKFKQTDMWKWTANVGNHKTAQYYHVFYYKLWINVRYYNWAHLGIHTSIGSFVEPLTDFIPKDIKGMLALYSKLWEWVFFIIVPFFKRKYCSMWMLLMQIHYISKAILQLWPRLHRSLILHSVTWWGTENCFSSDMLDKTSVATTPGM